MEYNPQRDVANMMKAFGQEVKPHPEMPDAATRLLRARLLFEECLETIRKGLGVQVSTAWGDEQHIIDSIVDVNLNVVDEGNLVELGDGLGDTLVVTYGAANAAGINMQPVFEEIHSSNMSKTYPDGTVKRDDFGKVIKPAHYRPANVAKVLGMASGS